MGAVAGQGDLIRVSGIRARGFHGVFPEEKRDGQLFVVDVELCVDLARPGTSDDLAHTVNYAEVAADVVARIEGEPFDLIERLARVIAQDCVARPLVEAVTVTVHKPQAPVGVPFGDVEVVARVEAPLRSVVVAVGANLGDAAETVVAAVEALETRGLVLGSSWSGLFETEPVGGPEQAAYVNAVVTGRTRLAPHHLLRCLHEIEAEHGRVREVRWGARTLDLDLVQYGTPGEADEVRSQAADLTLPHPRSHERGFVLVPWLAADPGARMRVGEEVRVVAEIVGRVDVTGVRQLDDDGFGDGYSGGTCSGDGCSGDGCCGGSA